jgi:hypothetical protein
LNPTAATQFSPEQLFNIARQRQAEGALQEARQAYEQILRQIPFHAESMMMLASIFYQEGDELQAEAYVDRAIEIYQGVLSHMPGKISARAPLVNLLLARDRVAEAEQFVVDLDLQINPIRATPEEFIDRRRGALARGLPSLLINTVPKSASESIWNKLAEGLGLAQCHLSIGLFPNCCLVPARLRTAAEGGIIAKEHLPATAFNVKLLAEHGLKRMVFHVRDPRQATLSWAHFVRDDVSMRLMGPLWRKIVPPADVLRQDLEKVIDWSIDNYLPLLVEFIQGWQRVGKDPDRALEVKFMSFETFLGAPEAYFDQVIEFTGIDPTQFAADAEAEIVHLRKGEREEWRGAFTEAQTERAWALMAPEPAEALGWVP